MRKFSMKTAVVFSVCLLIGILMLRGAGFFSGISNIDFFQSFFLADAVLTLAILLIYRPSTLFGNKYVSHHHHHTSPPSSVYIVNLSEEKGKEDAKPETTSETPTPEQPEESKVEEGDPGPDGE